MCTFVQKKKKTHTFLLGCLWGLVTLRGLENSYTFPTCPGVQGGRDRRKAQALVWNFSVGKFVSSTGDPEGRILCAPSLFSSWLHPFLFGKLIKPTLPWNLGSDGRHKLSDILLISSGAGREQSYLFSVVFWNAHFLVQRFVWVGQSSVRRRQGGQLPNWQWRLF